jgi:hypothetical protein
MLGYPFRLKSYDKIYTAGTAIGGSQDLFNTTRTRPSSADAGYPNGFKTTIDCVAVDVDLLSVVKADLIKIGVDMDIHQMEKRFQHLSRSRAHKEPIMKALSTTPSVAVDDGARRILTTLDHRRQHFQGGLRDHGKACRS